MAKKKILLLLGLIAISIVIFITIYLINQQQDLRQRASESVQTITECDAQTIACAAEFQQNKTAACASKPLVVDNLLSRDDSPCKGQDRAFVEQLVDEACTQGCAGPTSTPLPTPTNTTTPPPSPTATISPTEGLTPTTPPTLSPTQGSTPTTAPTATLAPTNIIVSPTSAPTISISSTLSPTATMTVTATPSGIQPSLTPTSTPTISAPGEIAPTTIVVLGALVIIVIGGLLIFVL